MAENETFIKIHDRALDALLADISRAIKKDIPTLIRERAQFFARYMAENTSPWVPGDGASLAARNCGRAAVRRDIRKVYSPASKVYGEMKQFTGGSAASALGIAMAKAFYRHVKMGEFSAAKQILRASGLSSRNLDIVAWDGGAKHRELRKDNGRVASRHASLIVADSKAMERYMMEVEKRVGYTKSAWITGANMISGRGNGRVPGWFRNMLGPGTGEDHTNSATPSIIITNNVKWASKALNEGSERRAQRDFGISLKSEFEHALAAIARRDAARALTLARAA